MKLQRWSVYSEYGYEVYNDESDDGDWCDSDSVRELEESHQRLLDALNFVLEHDYGYVLEEDVRAFIQDAISKSIQ